MHLIFVISKTLHHNEVITGKLTSSSWNYSVWSSARDSKPSWLRKKSMGLLLSSDLSEKSAKMWKPCYFTDLLIPLATRQPRAGWCERGDRVESIWKAWFSPSGLGWMNMEDIKQNRIWERKRKTSKTIPGSEDLVTKGFKGWRGRFEGRMCQAHNRHILKSWGWLYIYTYTSNLMFNAASEITRNCHVLMRKKITFDKWVLQICDILCSSLFLTIVIHSFLHFWLCWVFTAAWTFL